MNSLAPPPRPPHYHEHSRLSPTRSMSSTTPSSSRKRKASPEDDDDLMTTSPAISHARLPSQPQSQTQSTTTPRTKRHRANLSGRPLTFDRLLETLDRDSLTTIIRTLSTTHPHLQEEMLHISPRPSIQSTLSVLRSYHNKLRSSFPLGPNPRSDYSYNRVHPQWNDLLNALADFTPHFLPPNESQSNVSLEYLDGVTDIIHDLPEWDTPSHNLAKQNAYEEISRAWAVVIREAGKRGGGIQLQYGGWEEKIARHNEKSGGLMKEACEECMAGIGWLRSSGNSGQGAAGSREGNSNLGSREAIRQQLFSGTYGPEGGMRTGTW